MNEVQTLLQQVSAYSYLGVFVISLLANMFVPVPEEVVIIMIGYGVGTGVFSLVPTIILVFLGILISDCILYYFAKRGLRILVVIYEKYFGKMGVAGNEGFMKRHVNKIIFISRFIIQFRFLGPFLAGHFKVPFKRFLAYEIAALIIYVPGILWLGIYFQSRIDYLLQGVNQAKNIILLIIGLVVFLSLLQLFKKWFVKYLSHPHVEKVKNLFK